MKRSVEAKNNYDKTSLHNASEGGHLNIVKYLIEDCHLDVEAIHIDSAINAISSERFINYIKINLAIMSVNNQQ